MKNATIVEKLYVYETRARCAYKYRMTMTNQS